MFEMCVRVFELSSIRLRTENELRHSFPLIYPFFGLAERIHIP